MSNHDDIVLDFAKDLWQFIVVFGVLILLVLIIEYHNEQKKR